jgi:hypothetical protein
MKVGRNDPCPCESGKKYKQCCALKQEQRSRMQDSLFKGVFLLFGPLVIVLIGLIALLGAAILVPVASRRAPFA